jgi:DNA mismatch repair protein MutL
VSKIVQLDTHLANMIAAGEVVEKPSSVVKELVENSIDAGASQITINLQESGTKLIEVIDNGSGMSEEDAKMCFSRHATSKIKNQYDLFRISTLGFRGEAIPSIASVSKFSLFTSDGNESTNVNYNAGKLVSVLPCAMNRGTKIMVENLFFNVPARLKYLKSLKSELGSITFLISKFILANPGLSFTLTNDKKVIYKTNGSNDIVEVFGELYGLNVARNLVTDSFKEEGYSINLTCGKNMISRSNKLELTTIVNGRFVKSNVINDAVCEAYKTLIPEGRYPIALINITIDPLLIDVNVHPSKMTIKIANEREMASLLTSHIRKILISDNLIPDAVEQEGYKKASLLNDLNEALDFNEISAGEKIIKKNVEEIDEDDKNIFSFSSLISSKKSDDFKETNVELNEEKNNYHVDFKSVNDEDVKDVDSNLETIPLAMRKSNDRIPNLNYIGQIHGTYLIFESEDGMYIMDQHAAAERINYEYYYNVLANPKNERIQLLVSENVELTKFEYDKMSDLIPNFESLGFKLEPSGPQSYFVREIPTWVRLEDVSDFIHNLINDFKNNFNLQVMSYRDYISKQISCKASIKANHIISKEEVAALVKRLRECNNPFTCPHGRPTIIRYSKKDLEKMFMRIM